MNLINKNTDLREFFLANVASWLPEHYEESLTILKMQKRGIMKFSSPDSHLFVMSDVRNEMVYVFDLKTDLWQVYKKDKRIG